jgi:triosephosphate isomerase
MGTTSGRQLIAGNWKMNGTLKDGSAIVAAVSAGADGLGFDLLICPPATLLTTFATVLDGGPVMLGGQDCHAKPSGAHTGDISAAMLKDAGAAWVILGHSERRADHGETDSDVLAKVAAAVREGLTPIVCVGETEAQRQAGEQNAVIGAQLVASLPSDFKGVVAYEPIWAIGTGRTPTEADVAAMHAFIRATLASHLGAAGQGMLILYGGSMKPSNAAALLALPNVGGGLIGGASLNAADFLAIAHASVPVAADALSR